MIVQRTTYQTNIFEYLLNKVSDYIQLVKLRLSFLVVFSSVMGYLLASYYTFDFSALLGLVIGGFMITAASNAFNQILEKDIDKLMKRTMNRPLPSGRMTVLEASITSGFLTIGGTAFLWIYTNPLCTGLALLSLIIYTLVYTPLKRVSSISVFVGAFPGASAVLLGWVSVTGTLGYEALLIFAIQFIWQFPHTWSIAWLLADDYKKVGIKMTPSKIARSKNTAFQSALYAFFLIPISLLPAQFFGLSLLSTIVIVLLSIVFFLQALKLFKTCDNKVAARLMLASVIYLPVVQIVLVLDKFVL